MFIRYDYVSKKKKKIKGYLPLYKKRNRVINIHSLYSKDEEKGGVAGDQESKLGIS